MSLFQVLGSHSFPTYALTSQEKLNKVVKSTLQFSPQRGAMHGWPPHIAEPADGSTVKSGRGPFLYCPSSILYWWTLILGQMGRENCFSIASRTVKDRFVGENQWADNWQPHLHSLSHGFHHTRDKNRYSKWKWGLPGTKTHKKHLFNSLYTHVSRWLTISVAQDCCGFSTSSPVSWKTPKFQTNHSDLSPYACPKGIQAFYASESP